MLLVIFQRFCSIWILGMKEEDLRNEAFPNLPLAFPQENWENIFLEADWGAVSVGLDGVQLIQFISSLTGGDKTMFLPCLFVYLSVGISWKFMEGYRTEISMGVMIERRIIVWAQAVYSVWLAGCPAGTHGSVTCHRIYCFLVSS